MNWFQSFIHYLNFPHIRKVRLVKVEDMDMTFETSNLKDAKLNFYVAYQSQIRQELQCQIIITQTSDLRRWCSDDSSYS